MIQYFLIMRFSIRIETGLKNPKDLLKDKRLTERFFFFEHFALPSLINQTRRIFKCILLIDRALPKKWFDRLKHLIRDHMDIFIIHIWDPIDLITSPNYLRKYVKNGTNYIFQTRLDDDDLLNVNFFERLSKYSPRQCVGKFILPSMLNEVVCTGGKYYVRPAKKGYSPGITFVSKVSSLVSIYCYDHSRIMKDWAGKRIIDKTSLTSVMFTDHPSCDSSRFVKSMKHLQDFKETPMDVILKQYGIKWTG